MVKEISCNALTDYYEAMKDEERLLYQKAKVDWLKLNEGDRNSAFFRKILKRKKAHGTN